MMVCALVAASVVLGAFSRQLASEPILGHPAGTLFVDVDDLACLRPLTLTISLDPVGSRSEARRLLQWRDDSHLQIPLAAGGEVVLDVAHAPGDSCPASSRPR